MHARAVTSALWAVSFALVFVDGAEATPDITSNGRAQPAASAAPAATPRNVSVPPTPEEDCQCSAASRTPPRTRSVGWPWHGRLRNGVRLRPSDTLRFMHVDRPRGNFYGTPALVGLLQRVAQRVDVLMPGARLNVGELSKRGGGNIVGHRSHENGRDVDLGFYVKDQTGMPVETRAFVNMDRRGIGRLGADEDSEESGEIFFDDVRNWLMMETLATDPEVVVQFAFVHRDIRHRLLETGRRLGASNELLAKVERVVISPGVRHPHRNHFHVRIYCAASDVPECKDRGPYWPWLATSHPFAQRIVPLRGWPPEPD